MKNNHEIITDSRVEQLALERSGRKFIYSPIEKIAVLEVDNFPALGKLTALRFIEWVQNNPDGVISLPTGKTPEHFIKWVIRYLQDWKSADIQKDLEDNGVDPAKYPHMKGLRFVQIDEFYPINPTQVNSFYYYINQFYIRGFGLDPKKALLINAWNLGTKQNMTPADVFPDEVVDLDLRTRHPRSYIEGLQKEVIEAVDQYCTDYEDRIRSMGGIGFFLGGIGPDGHIGFNVKGSDHYSTTRLTATNYETQAAAATDLGGIEVARNRLVITIGLSTITCNPEVVALIIAAGEAKARVIKNAIEEPISNLYPATALHTVARARFYITKGAGVLLTERRYENVTKLEPLPKHEIEHVVVDLAQTRNKRLEDLDQKDFESIRSSAWIFKKTGLKPREITAQVAESLQAKIERGSERITKQTILHTAPHHDDIILGYWAYVVHLVRDPSNVHHFAYLTSGFNAVTNRYARSLLETLSLFIDTPYFRQLMEEGYFDPNNESGRNRDVHQFLDGVAANSTYDRQEGEARRILRNMIFLFEENSFSQLKNRISEMILYFKSQYPGKKDLPYIQQFKGMIREWESDLKWGHLGFNTAHVHHMRLGFYKGEIFTEDPKVERDVLPMLQLLKKIKPTVVTVAFDPEGSGPDTHYKVLQTISEALKIYSKESGRKNIEVWGYRNVWYRFHPSEANVFIPVSLNSLSVLEDIFLTCFGSQATASFPSYELDGPFSQLSRKVLVEQYQLMKLCLGRVYFNENPVPRMRAAHGMTYLKKMGLEEFYTHSTELRKRMEDV
ncbi:glucosamine-6-phosphate deaminase [candidate division KSB1 bacterium]|nr:glucosamine-6-phosphate deaminase [candidate division KSB1 bacterium]